MRILQLRRGRLLKGLLAAVAAAAVVLLLASHVSSPVGSSLRSAGALVVRKWVGLGGGISGDGCRHMGVVVVS